ncbi:TonB-dependent receptor [Arsukibacterium ikkense]|uniref:TonB-dependent receptor n=1 Tax=Arsukibacterium ikkense TaxID=336831 RepID=A0A0M2UZI5_9GAMM|nr:TonB-dependent receptor [Arsukibacterium ikkense]KKO43962.1 TonB-dependent receptor [Arsukibacterium ikkense]
MLRKTLRKMALASAIGMMLFAANAAANSISGTVLDAAGKPAANVEVSVSGTAIKVLTDSQGRFELTGLAAQQVELHLAGRRIAHRNIEVQVPAQGLTNLTLTVKPTPFEVIDVTASPLHASITESSLPVSVLAGEQLKMRQAATLGDTLKYEVGVHSNFYGGVASSPIIRGLDGPRVLITQNGLDAGDASRVGPDHSVATEASTATQIEVLRGPATLFYGSGAIGGVVNIVDERVPTDSTPRAEWIAQLQSVNSEKLLAGSAVNGNDLFAVYVDGFWRDSIDYKGPHGHSAADEHDGDDHDRDEGHGERIENTFSRSQGGTIGGSYLLENGFVGLSYGRLERKYGIPGHSHGGHAESGDSDEEVVFADKKQDRFQLQSSLFYTDSWLSQVNTKLAYTDYQHAEIEDGEIGTLFSNKSHEARLELLHRPWQDWKGGLSLHYKYSDFKAIGDEAFSPPSDSTMLAAAWMAERHFGPVLLQLGARTERVSIKAPQVLLPMLELHGHDDGHDDHGHDDHGHGPDITRIFDFNSRYNPYSLSAGIVYDFTPGYNVGVSVSRAERAPSAAELLSFGPHIGTNSYEVGAVFKLNDAQDGFVLNPDGFKTERSNNIDLTLRKVSGNTGFVLNAFYNRVDNYYFQQFTGLFAEVSHDEHGDEHDDHGHNDHADDEHTDELPVYLYTNRDVNLYGLEAQFVWQISQPVRFTLQGDYVRGSVRGAGELPRTPPLRLLTSLAYEGNNYDADITLARYFRQGKVAALESATAGYSMLDASVSYRFNFAGQELVAFLKGQNLLDQRALVHTSFLKDDAPLPGRGLAVGLRGRF